MNTPSLDISSQSIVSDSGTQERKALAYAKKGIFLALLSGLVFSIDGFLVKRAGAFSPYNDTRFMLFIPFMCAGIHDLCAACVTTSVNWRAGRLPEIWRSLFSKPGKYVVAGALFGAIFGMGGYMAALQLAGPAFVLPITSLYPAVAAVLAVFVLKERILPRAWIGLLLCVGGVVVIGYVPPEGEIGRLFYWGLAFAALAAIGWGMEGVCATSGMDFIEPAVALNIYYLISSTLYCAVLIPFACFFLSPQSGNMSYLGDFVTSRGTLFVACAGCLGSYSYLCWYRAMNMTGVSRAMALNISYALWGILLTVFFTDEPVTRNLILGAAVIFIGMLLVIGNLRDMLNLRNVS